MRAFLFPKRNKSKNNDLLAQFLPPFPCMVFANGNSRAVLLTVRGAGLYVEIRGYAPAAHRPSRG
jgi:hypothetical protein